MSRVLSPSVDNPTAYGKPVMDKSMKAKNTPKKKKFISGFLLFPNPLFLERLIFNMKEEILSLKLRDFVPNIKGRLTNHAL